jgi:hypothetical protein
MLVPVYPRLGSHSGKSYIAPRWRIAQVRPRGTFRGPVNMRKVMTSSSTWRAET